MKRRKDYYESLRPKLNVISWGGEMGLEKFEGKATRATTWHDLTQLEIGAVDNIQNGNALHLAFQNAGYMSNPNH